jgi:hypothetical protein
MDYDDIINQFDRSCSCSNLSDTTFGVASECSAKDIGSKLMVHLEEKIKQLEANKEDNKVFQLPFILTKNSWIRNWPKI